MAAKQRERTVGEHSCCWAERGEERPAVVVWLGRGEDRGEPDRREVRLVVAEAEWRRLARRQRKVVLELPWAHIRLKE